MEIRAGKRWRTREERLQIVEETLKPEASVAQVALAHGINANQIFHWRRQYREGRFDGDSGQALVRVKIAASKPAKKTADRLDVKRRSGKRGKPATPGRSISICDTREFA